LSRRSFEGQRSEFLFPARQIDRLSLCLVLEKTVDWRVSVLVEF
jgi:hypothetical protein